MNYFFRSKSHPEANGRTPIAGEEAFRIEFPSEDGGKIEICMGRQDFVNCAARIVRCLQGDPALNCEVEDAAEQTKVLKK